MSKTYDEKLKDEDYLRGLIQILMRKYSFSKKEAVYYIIMSSYIWPSLIEYPEENLHDDIKTITDNIYEEYIPCFNHHYYGWYHLYAHVHNSFEWNMMERTKYEMKELYDRPCNMYNAGAMMPYMNYTPRTLEEIITGADSLTDKEIEVAKRCDIKN